MESSYKVLDKVLIKKEYDPGCNGFDYSYYFAEDMLTEHGGSVCTISKVEH